MKGIEKGSERTRINPDTPAPVPYRVVGLIPYDQLPLWDIENKPDSDDVLPDQYFVLAINHLEEPVIQPFDPKAHGEISQIPVLSDSPTHDKTEQVVYCADDDISQIDPRTDQPTRRIQVHVAGKVFMRHIATITQGDDKVRLQQPRRVELLIVWDETRGQFGVHRVSDRPPGIHAEDNPRATIDHANDALNGSIERASPSMRSARRKMASRRYVDMDTHRNSPRRRSDSPYPEAPSK